MAKIYERPDGRTRAEYLEEQDRLPSHRQSGYYQRLRAKEKATGTLAEGRANPSRLDFGDDRKSKGGGGRRRR